MQYPWMSRLDAAAARMNRWLIPIAFGLIVLVGLTTAGRLMAHVANAPRWSPPPAAAAPAVTAAPGGTACPTPAPALPEALRDMIGRD